MAQQTFGALLNVLYPDTDPYALTGGKDASRHRLVRCRDYADRPHELGEYWAPGVDMQKWMLPLVDQPGRVVSMKQVSAAREQGYACLAHSSCYYHDQSSILVIEQDTLIVPSKHECRGLEQPGLPPITTEELAALQPTVVLQAAQQTGLPFAGAVHSGGKSAHLYFRIEGLPDRPLMTPGWKDAPPEAQAVIERRRLAARTGDYSRWHWFVEGLLLAMGTLDMGVLSASGRHGNTRTPGGIRRSNGRTQDIMALGRATTFTEMIEWVDAQLSSEARDWWHGRGTHHGRVPQGHKNPLLPLLLNMRDPGCWKDMLLRRTVQGGSGVDEQALTKQWMSVIAELEPTQRQPVIHRQPNWEEGDWGHIEASFMWWVSALTINTLHYPLTVNHPEAPTPYGWFFTGNQWWWEDGNGKPHNIREIWKPGASGGLHQRLNISPSEYLTETWVAQLGEGKDHEIRTWWEEGGDGRTAPVLGMGEVQYRLPGKAQVAAEARRSLNTERAMDRQAEAATKARTREEREQEKIKRQEQQQQWEQIAEVNANSRREMFLALFEGPVIYCTEQAPPFGDTWLRFDGRIWKRVSKTIVEGFAHEAFMHFPIVNPKTGDERAPQTKDRTELIKQALYHNRNRIQHDTRWVQNPNAIAFRNGTLYVDSEQCDSRPFEWNPDDHTYHLMDYDFDQEIETPLFDLMMQTMFPNSMEREVVLQFMGYLFDPTNPYKKFLLLRGHTDSGKTTLQEVLTALAGGDDYTTSPSIASMTQDRYWASNMETARLIKIDEQTDTPVQFAKGAASLFKLLTGDGTVEVRRMRMDPYNTKIRAKMVVTTNNLPRFSDDSTAFWDRCLYIEPQVPVKKIKNLSRMIIADELPGVAALAAQALSRLKRQGGFVQTPEMIARIGEFRESNSPLIEFFNEWMEPAGDDYCCIPSVMFAINATKSHGTFQSVANFVQVLRSTFPDISISRYTREAALTKTIHHWNNKNQRKSVWALRGYRCVHPSADLADGPPMVEREIQGTAEDHTTIPFPRRGVS